MTNLLWLSFWNGDSTTADRRIFTGSICLSMFSWKNLNCRKYLLQNYIFWNKIRLTLLVKYILINVFAWNKLKQIISIYQMINYLLPVESYGILKPVGWSWKRERQKEIPKCHKFLTEVHTHQTPTGRGASSHSTVHVLDDLTHLKPCLSCNTWSVSLYVTPWPLSFDRVHISHSGPSRKWTSSFKK